MGYWSIIVPEAATNLITNPSIEIDTTGFTASGTGASIAQTTFASNVRYGGASLDITPGSGVNNGCYYSLSLTNGQLYTFSVIVKATAGTPLKLVFKSSFDVEKGTPTTWTASGGWERKSVGWTADATTTFRLHLQKNNSDSTAHIFSDAWQCVILGTPFHDTSYIDGDQPGCTWLGTPHASKSERDGQYRGGGQEINLDSLGVFVTATPGIGMPPNKHHTQSLAQQPGAQFQGRKILPRTFLLRADITGTSRANLHSLRKTLLNYIKPDRTYPDQPFKLRYTGGNATLPVEINVVYDSGAEWKEPDGYNEDEPIRLIANDPFWYEEGNEGGVATPHYDIIAAAYGLRKVSKTLGWNELQTSGFNGAVYCVTIDRARNVVYFGGTFTLAGGVTVNRICKYDPATNTFTALGVTPGTSGDVLAIAIAPNGKVYAGGTFLTAGGVTVNNVAVYDPGTNTWAALGVTGVSATVRGLCVAKTGLLYATGDFITAAGTTVNYFASWDGTAWAALGGATKGLGALGRAVVEGLDRNIYVTGDFTSAGGTAGINRIVKYDPAAVTYTGLGTGLNASGRCLAVGANGDIYEGGDNTTAGGVTVNYIARWGGANWYALGVGVGAAVHCMAFHPNGYLYLGGPFTNAGGLFLNDRMAIWNGATFVPVDVKLPGSPTVYGIAIDWNENIYIGYDTTGTAIASYLNIIINNGTNTSYPVFRCTWVSGGSGVIVQYLESAITGKRIWLNYPMLVGETLTIDCTPMAEEIRSDFYGRQMSTLLDGSDLAGFGLQPGVNYIYVFVKYTTLPTLRSTLQWPIRHWSADGAAV